MKRIISAVAVALSLGTTAALADVQASFPDGYVIVAPQETAPRADTGTSAAFADVQTSFPDGYQVVDHSVVATEQATAASQEASVSITEAPQSLPEPSFRDYPTVS